MTSQYDQGILDAIGIVSRYSIDIGIDIVSADQILKNLLDLLDPEFRKATLDITND